MMLIDHHSVVTREPTRPRRRRGRRRSGRAQRLAAGLSFLGAASLILLYALRGGAYDVTVFQAYGVVIWWLLCVGFALRLLPRSRPSPAVLILAGAMLAYVAWTALSLLWTESAERTTVEIARTADYLGLIVLFAAVLDRNTWRQAAAGLGFGALVVCLLGVLSRLDPGAFPTDHVAQAFRTDRLSYPLGYWNAVAAWGAMSTAIGLAWSAQAPNRIHRAVALAFVPAAVTATYLTYSRAGVAGTALAVVLVVALSRARFTALLHAGVAAAGSAAVILVIRDSPQIARATGTHGAGDVALTLGAAMFVCGLAAVGTVMLRSDSWSVPRRLARPVLAAALVVVLVVAGVIGPRAISRGWHSFSHPARQTSVQGADPATRLLSLSSSRYLVWQSAVHAFDHKPATGTGAGTFAFWWNRHATDYEFLHDAHNIWLQNLAELGLPGLLLIVAVAVGALIVGVSVRLRVRRRPSVGASVAFLSAFIVFLMHATVDWMWEATAVTVLAVSGIAVIGARLSGPRPRLRWFVRGALVAIAALAGAIQIPGLLSTTDIRHSQAAVRAGNLPLALAWANDGVSAEPWAASPYEQRGLVLEAAGRLQQAATDLHRAIRREETNFTHWVVLARIETELGELSAAEQDYQQAHTLRPLADVFEYAPYFRLH